MFDHMDTNSFLESRNQSELSLSEVSSASLEKLLAIARSADIEQVDKLEDIFSLDQLCERFLVQQELRAKMQSSMWPRLKEGVFESYFVFFARIGLGTFFFQM